MRELNLISMPTQIGFKHQSFPDGQQNVVIVAETTQEVLIKARMNNFKDLELIICAAQSLKHQGTEKIHLYTPYFLGSRSDRKFELGGNNYLKDVICPIINSLNLVSIEVYDPHSDVLEACLNNYKKENNNGLVCWALRDIVKNERQVDELVLISPDGGALKKIYKLTEEIKFNGNVVNCHKNRDTNGQITKTEVPYFDLTKDCVIIDDICDGGRTFIEIAKVIKHRRETAKPEFTGKTYLIVSHGIFSKGFSELSRYIDGIYCTNSYSDIKDEPLVKQFNIF